VLQSRHGASEEVVVATFLLVHPAWFGGWCWDKVASQLRRHGHRVHAPTLTGLAERAHLASPDVGLATHIDDVAQVVTFDDLTDVILVGSSSGGTVITGAADRLPGRIASLVYLDAFVPADGQSTRDLLPPDRQAALDSLVEAEGSGWLLPRFAPPPWPSILRNMWQVVDEADVAWVIPRLRPTPYRHFTDRLRVTDSNLAVLDRVYVRCPRQPAPFDVFAAAARSDPRWKYRELDTPHVPFVTHPDEVTKVLLEVAARHPSGG
jgi:pimeloyl-ACP methyl ester carboxylesterase